MKRRGLFILAAALALILLGVLAYYYDEKVKNRESEDLGSSYCTDNRECVPDGCCHPKSCVNLKEKQTCSGVICSSVCEPGSLDCGQGTCQCINKKCEAVLK